MLGSAAFRTGVALAPSWVKNELWRRARAVPSLDLRFADDKSLVDATTGASLVTFTRASSGTFVGSDGVLRTAVTNLLLRSEEFNDASWPRSGTTLPTITTNAGIAPDGNTTADLWTRSITGPNFISQAIGKSASAIQYTFSVFVKQSVGNFCALRCQGTFPNKVDVTFNLNLGTIHTGPTVAGGTFTGPSASITPYPNGWYRLAVTATSDTAVSYQCIVSFNSNGGVIDGTDSVSNSAGLLWGAQLEQSATANEYIPTTNVINSAPRFDHNPTTGESLGLLVEGQRTNSIRNNTMVGAVAGTPGTLPTNWSTFTTTSGISRTIVGTGTENGITYIDLQIAGTATANVAITIANEPNNFVAAANGQSWTYSAYVKLVAGSFSGFNSPQLILEEYSAVATFLAGQTTNVPAPTTTLTRLSATRTNTNALTAFEYAGVRHYVNNGNTVDMTLRIGLPQLEQGAFATSVILTSTAAATRSADVASIGSSAFSSWYRQDEGTVFAEYKRLVNASGRILTFNDTTANEQIRINATLSTSIRPDWQVIDGGVVQANVLGVAEVAVGATGKTAGTYKLNNFQQATNSTLGTADTAGTLPTLTVLNIGANETGGASMLNGTMRRLTYWPTRLPDNTLQSITQ